MKVVGPKHLPLVAASHEGITRNVDDWNANVLGFDVGDTEFHLQSALTSVECLTWVDAYLAGMEDYHGSPNQDAEDFCSATGVIEENSRDCRLAIENAEVNFCAVDDAAVHESGESSCNLFINDLDGEFCE